MTHVLSGFGLTRDSLLWFWGKLVAVVLALAGLAQMGQAGASILAHMGIQPAWQPYILFAAFIIGIFSGHYSTSPLAGENDGNTVSNPNQRGFAFIVIPIVIAILAGAAIVARVHVPLLSPHTKVQAAKTDRLAFEAVRSLQVEEEKLFKNGSVPALHALQPDGKTMHQHIAVAELAVFHLIERVAITLQNMPTGGVLSVGDLRFVDDLEHAVADLITLIKPVLGTTLANAIDAVNAQVASFSATAKAVKS